MKQSVEGRLAALEGGRQPWPEVEWWIVHGATATNQATGETIRAEELERREREGRLLIVNTIVESDGDGRPKGALPPSRPP